MRLNINGELRAVDPAWQQETLLTILREHLGLVGAKLGCGVGLCGACTVLVDGDPRRSCLLTPEQVQGRAVVTVEGLAAGGRLHPVQQAWLNENVAQCGYCQAGQIVAAAALLRAHPAPSDAQIEEALQGHLCRCGTQQRVRAAVRRAARSAA